MQQIELATKHLADARAALAARVQVLTRAMDTLERRSLPAIRKLVATCAEKHAVVFDLVSDNKPLFEKPRTQIFHGIKVGYAKQKGSIQIEDPERCVALIKKHFADNPPLLELLINRKETPDKESIADLPVADAKKIGCHLQDAAEVVVIRATDAAVDKIVNALLKDAVQDAVEEAVAA